MYKKYDFKKLIIKQGYKIQIEISLEDLQTIQECIEFTIDWNSGDNELENQYRVRNIIRNYLKDIHNKEE